MRIAVVLTMLLACGSGPPPPVTPVTTPDPAPRPAAEPAIVDPRAPVVRMLLPGTAPRHLLRYHLAPATIEYMELDMRLGIETAFDDPTLGLKTSKVDTPTMRMTIRTTVTEVLPTGDARLAYELVGFELLQDVPLPDPQRTALEASLGQLAGMTGTARLSARGVPSELAFDIPNATPQLEQMMESLRDAMRQMYVPLPIDAVGKGAKWETRARYAVNNMQFDSKIIYLMTARSEDRLEVQIESALTADPQSFPLGGMTGSIKSSSGIGNGKLSQPLTRIVGTGDNSVTSDTQFSVDDGAKTLNATMHMTAVVAVRPGQPAKKP